MCVLFEQLRRIIPPRFGATNSLAKYEEREGGGEGERQVSDTYYRAPSPTGHASIDPRVHAKLPSLRLPIPSVAFREHLAGGIPP